MPLPCGEGRVASLPKGMRPGLIAHELFIDVEIGPAGHQHCAGGHAGGAVITALHIGAREGQPALHEAIKVRGLDVRITQSRNRIRALVIGEDEDNIGRLSRVGSGRQSHKGKEKETGHARLIATN